MGTLVPSAYSPGSGFLRHVRQNRDKYRDQSIRLRSIAGIRVCSQTNRARCTRREGRPEVDNV